MSEEEKKAIEELKSWREYIVNHIDSVNKANDIEFYLRTVLNLIQKQENEIDYLKDVKMYLVHSHISKDKIREKIKELEEFIESSRTLPLEIIQEQNCNARYKIEVLKELLEE